MRLDKGFLRSVSAWPPALALLSELYRSQLTPDGRIIGSVACSLPDRRRALALLSGLWRPCGAQAPSVPGQLASGQGLVMLCKPSQQRTEDLVATLGRPVTVVSRLDSPTSGVLPVVLAAPTSRVASCFEAQFAGRMVDKDYVCLCEGAPMGRSLPFKKASLKAARCGGHLWGGERRYQDFAHLRP